jgi:hypothetical protein
MAKHLLPVSFRLPLEIKTAAEKAAADDHRSFSSLVEKVLADYLKKHGYLPAVGELAPAKARSGRPAKGSNSGG